MKEMLQQQKSFPFSGGNVSRSVVLAVVVAAASANSALTLNLCTAPQSLFGITFLFFFFLSFSSTRTIYFTSVCVCSLPEPMLLS